MDNVTYTPDASQPSPGNIINIAGYTASRDFMVLPGKPLSRTPEEFDRASLQKLWETGFNVETLDEAHERYKLSPLRVLADIWQMLGHTAAPRNGKGAPRYTEDKHLTSLAIQYPSLLNPGEVLRYDTICRVRYPSRLETIRSKSAAGGPGVEERRYDQPIKLSPNQSTSEPYFLFGTHARLYDTSLPLLITEGELKGASLGLAGFAAIAFGGAHMWTAPKKAGKNKLHPALDPEGPNKTWAIPIKDRPVYLIPDRDFVSNASVRKTFEAFGTTLLMAGAQPHLVILPTPSRTETWKGVDDYLQYKLQPRWSKDESTIAAAVALIETLLNNAKPVLQSDYHSALGVTRGAYRLLDMLQQPEGYTAILTGTNSDGDTNIGWLRYKDERYTLHYVDHSVGNTSGKVVTPSKDLQRMCRDAYKKGVNEAFHEGEIAEKAPDMPSDYPNKITTEVNLMLAEFPADTVIQPFPGVRENDFCLRVNRALINLTRFFETDGRWDDRLQWLLPPNSMWFSPGHMNVSLNNLEHEPTCPVFMQMVNHAFADDQASIDTLQLFLGKIICSPMFLGRQQFLALYGEAGGGKGTLYRLVQNIIGKENIAVLRAQFGGRFDTAGLPGKKLAVFQETPDGTAEQFSLYMAEVVKNLTGEDDIVYERKGQNQKTTNVPAEVLMIGNAPPCVPMDAGAFRRRAVFLRVQQAIAERDHRKEKHMVAHELAGIFLWALRGACKLDRGVKIETPPCCLEDLEDATTSVAPEDRYVQTQIKQVPDTNPDRPVYLSTSAVIEHYQDWVRKTGGRYNPVSNRRLFTLIRRVWKVESQPCRLTGRMERVYRGLAFVTPMY